MIRREMLGLLGAGAGVLVLPGCREMFPKRFRFKMTVEIDTPQGLRSGSSVMEMSVTLATFKLPDSHAVNLKFRGEAVAVDLPGGTLFALIGMDDFEAMVIDTFDPTIPRAKKLVALFEELGQHRSIGRSVTIPPNKHPRLVRFRDIRDPSSVELVDPNDIAKSYDAGVKLKRIFLTVVDGPVTMGIEKRLPWLINGRDAQLDGDRYETFSSFANSLNINNFKRGKP